MAKTAHHQFKVRLAVKAAGPIIPRRKYKEYKMLYGEKEMWLPFAPYPGLYITMSRPRKRGGDDVLYLRIRAVEWTLPAEEFTCVADEVLGSIVFMETMEVRGSPRIEEHFFKLQRSLTAFGFEVRTDMDEMYVAVHKDVNGIPFESHKNA